MHTIFGGKTLNGIEVDDMVDNDRDLVYHDELIGDQLFIRCNTIVSYDDQGIREPDLTQLGLIVYHRDAPYEPLYGKVLEKPCLDYFDDTGVGTQKLDDAVAKFWDEVKSDYELIMAEHHERENAKSYEDNDTLYNDKAHFTELESQLRESIETDDASVEHDDRDVGD